MRLGNIIVIAFVATAALEVPAAEVCEIWPWRCMPAYQENGPDATVTGKDGLVYTNVHFAALEIWRAKGSGPRPAVIVCPGGGYKYLSWTVEGEEIAKWLNEQGVSAFVLRYRVPDQQEGALCDGQRAISWVRAHAADYGVLTDRIGIMGFSAGANLAARVSTHLKERAYRPVDAVDLQSARPDFTLLIYPWALCKELGEPFKSIEPVLAKEFRVDWNVPPAFIVQANDDLCHSENAVAYQMALQQHRVPVELHLFPYGGHGYGVRKTNKPTDIWPDLAAIWLKRQCPMLDQ